MSTSGIYTITNTVTGRAYIGSSIKVPSRWSFHRSQLRNNKHDNRHLQASWNKHGENVFEFRLLEAVPSHDDLISRENFWISQFPMRYNIRPVAESNRGHKYPEEVRARWRGRVHSPDAVLRMRLAKLGKKMSAESRRRISVAKRGTKMSEATRRKMSRLRSGRKMPPRSESHRLALGAAKAQTYTIISPDGRVFDIKNLREFCRAHELNQAHMVKVSKGKQSSHAGWICHKAGEPPPVFENKKIQTWRFVSPDGELVIVQNLSKFCRERGLSQAGMWMVAKRPNRSHKGWTQPSAEDREGLDRILGA